MLLLNLIKKAGNNDANLLFSNTMAAKLQNRNAASKRINDCNVKDILKEGMAE
jgi:hypothetical protein